MAEERKNKKVPVKIIIPNMITSGSIFCGVSSLILTANQHLVPAAILIFCASFFDLMDGRVARTLGGGSAFGEELDSLADVVSFGVAPAFLIYCAYISPAFGILGPLAASFFALCGALRLARFNVTHVPTGPFQGLPIPAGGNALASIVVSGLPLTPLAAVAVLCFVGGLMVSSVPYCSAKRLKKTNVNVVKFCGVIFFIFLCFTILKEKAFLAIAVMYIISGLVKFDAAEWIMIHDDKRYSARTKD